MDPKKIILKYYNPKSKVYRILTKHSQMVTKKALRIAKKLKFKKLDLKFIKEAALLHDIGIIKTHAPGLGCYGKYHYICHGNLGRKILEKEGLKKHALVCERHVGVGLTKKDIAREKLPLPQRDMLPKTLEEKIICLADKFYSKNKKYLTKAKPIKVIRNELAKYGKDNVERFNQLLKLFGE